MAKYNRRTSDGYGLGTPIPGIFPAPIEAQRNPTTADRGQIGQVWVNTVSNQGWMASGAAGGITTWVLSSPGASDVDTINGLSPVLGNIVLTGGTNITDVNGGNIVTFNLDPAITLATSVTAPLYTAAAADVLIQTGGVNDVVCRLGDAAGATFFRIQSSTPADVFTVDSTGVMTFAGLTVTGAFTQTGGIANIGSDAAANAINIGTGAAAKPIIIGNGTGATSIALNCGTGALNIGTNAIAHIVTIGNVTGATAVNVNSGTGACAWTTTNGSFGLVTGTGAINIGADAAAKTITVGNTAGATAVNLTTGTSGSTITTTNGAFAVTTGTGAIDLGVDAFAHIVTIGNVTGATAVNLNAGTGGIGLASTGTGDITINSDDTLLLDADGVLELNSSAGVISIGNDADALGINVGTGAAQRPIIIGNVTGNTAITLNSGTGGIALNTTGAGDVVVTGSDTVLVDAVGVLELNSSGAAIGIGSDADAFAINIGTGAAARTITIGNGTGATSLVLNNGTGALNIGTNATQHNTTIGSTIGTSATVIQSGSGKIDFAGVVMELTADFVDVSGDKITFRQSPIVQSAANTGAAPTGATSDVNLLACENGMILEEFVLGAGQTIIAPRMTANGLLISGDLTATEGYEISWGATRANSKHSFTIGTSAAFYFQARFRLADVSGLEPFYMGFRKTQAYQVAGAIASYSDFVGYGVNDGVAPGDCTISTQLNTGGLNNTDTNDAWADTGVHTLRIDVSAAGVTTFLFDGSAPTVTQAYTFDNGDVVHPFIRHEFNAAAPGTIEIVSLEVGFA